MVQALHQTNFGLADPSDDVRPGLLMCAPSLYNVDYVINPWMQGNVGASSQARAMAQWTQLRDLLAEVATIQLIEPVVGSPDMVFTANAGLIHENQVVVSRFLHPERQEEEPHFRHWFEAAGYQVKELNCDLPFEGEGDALFSADGKRLWVGYGPRTDRASHAQLQRLWDVDLVGLHLVDPRFYHLDTCFAPLADGSLLYFPEAFDRPSLDAIERFYGPEQRVPVASSDALCFACNAISLGKTVVLNHISAELAATLRGRGLQVLETPLDEFLKAGGAAKCLVLHLSPHQQRTSWPFCGQDSRCST